MNKISKITNISTMTVKELYCLPSDGPVHEFIASILQAVAVLTEQNYRDIEVETTGDEDYSYPAISAVRSANETDVAEVRDWQRKNTLQYITTLTRDTTNRISSLNSQIEHHNNNKMMEEKMLPDRPSETETARAVKRINFIGHSLTLAQKQLEEAQTLLAKLNDINSQPESDRAQYANKLIKVELRNYGLDADEVTFNR